MAMWHNILSMQVQNYKRVHRPDLNDDDVWKILLHVCHNIIKRYDIPTNKVNSELMEILNEIRLGNYTKSIKHPSLITVDTGTNFYYLIVDDKLTPRTAITKQMAMSDIRKIQYNADKEKSDAED